MAVPRITRQLVEVIRGDTARATPQARVTRQLTEFLRGDTAITLSGARVTGVFVEQIIAVDATKKARFTHVFAEQIITSNFAKSARFTHLFAEQIITSPLQPKPRVSQVWADVIESFTSTAKPRVSQVWVDVIRTVSDTIDKQPPSADLTFSTSAPTVDLPISVNIEVPSGNLTLSSSAPTFAPPIDIEVPSGNLELSSFVPVEVVVATNIQVPSANLTLTTSPPLAATNDNLKVVPSANLRFTTSPVVRAYSEITVPYRDLLFSTSSPLVELSERIVPSANLTFSTSAPHSRVLIPYTPGPGLFLKMIILPASGSVTLPADWNPNANWIWAWGAGGRGAHAFEVGVFIASGGGGAGGFQQERNVGGAPGDVWTFQVGQKNLTDPFNRTANATYVQDASATTIALAHSGENGAFGGFGVGGLGGGGGFSQAASANRGGWGGVSGGGGGGGASGGPHSGEGTRGGDGRDGGGFGTLGVGGGGGGGGAVGDRDHPEDASLARAGGVGTQNTPGTNEDGDDLLDGRSGGGGPGYYGHGAGEGGLAANPGEDNTGGGASGGAAQINFTKLTVSILNGEDGGNWSYIQTLPSNRWMLSPFSWSTTSSGRFAELTNGTVPGGAGGGGGAGFGSLLGGGRGANGGKGGYPGGGGGGAGYDSNGLFGGTVGGDNALGGDGADGLIIIFYEGQLGDVCEPCEEDLSPCGEVAPQPCDIEWPYDELQPRGVGVFMVPATLGGGRAIDGQEQAGGTSHGFWRFKYEGIPIHTAAQIRRWNEIEATLEGAAGVICVHVYDGKRAPWLTVGELIDIRAAATFAAGSRTGAIEVVSGGVPVPGMLFSYLDRLYMLATVGAPVSGVYPVTLWPDVRSEIPNLAPLVFDRPTCRARLNSSMAIPLYLLQHSKQNVEFEED